MDLRRLKSSTLVQSFVSTSLAVGNVMNRGTSRQEARAVVLPEALLRSTISRRMYMYM